MRRVLTAAIAMTALLLGGCANDDSSTAQPAPSGSDAAAYPVSVGNVTLIKRPERIVSLAPSATEMLFAIDAGPQVVAVDDQSTYPADAPRSDLSGFKPNAEAIAAKNPDLVVISDDLNKIGEATAMVVNPETTVVRIEKVIDAVTVGDLVAIHR